jgi:RecG-like helicase
MPEHLANLCHRSSIAQHRRRQRVAEQMSALVARGNVGTRQSGMPLFRLADLSAHADLLAVARDEERPAS